MIKVINHVNSKLSWGAVEDISQKKYLSFVDVIYPTEDDLVRISVQTQIPLEELKEAVDPSERPHININGRYSLIIIRVPFDEKNGSVKTAPLALFSSKGFVIAFRHSHIECIERLKNFENPYVKKRFTGGASHLMYSILDDSIALFFRFLDMIDDQINLIEAKVYKKPKDTLLKNIFSVKKTLIYFHKALLANREVISQLHKENLDIFSKKDLKLLQNTYNDITQLIDVESTYRDILNGTLDLYMTNVSHNMNQIIKKMTAMGSFILIPTLISGIYGMNFQVLPETSWRFGYPFALGLMAASVILLYWYFSKNQWI